MRPFVKHPFASVFVILIPMCCQLLYITICRLFLDLFLGLYLSSSFLYSSPPQIVVKSSGTTSLSFFVYTDINQRKPSNWRGMEVEVRAHICRVARAAERYQVVRIAIICAFLSFVHFSLAMLASSVKNLNQIVFLLF